MPVPATRWTRLEDTALSEINQSQKEKYPSHKRKKSPSPPSLIMKGKFPETESCSELIEDCGDRERGRDLLLTGTESLSEKR